MNVATHLSTPEGWKPDRVKLSAREWSLTSRVHAIYERVNAMILLTARFIRRRFPNKDKFIDRFDIF